MVKNKVARISLMGGLLGLMLTNPRKALDDCINKHNAKGWRSTFIVPHAQRNILVIVIQLAFLVDTLGLWTWGAGYLVMFEKEE
ncbi:MAG: hypothetical protein V6Z86_08395 [Hyphomicrobiales bacterium]